jgi:hypothetical protein
MKIFIYLTIITASLSIFSCKKETNNKPDPATDPANNCSTIGFVQDTVVDNGTIYYIVSTLELNNGIGIELASNSNSSPANLTFNFLQTKNGNNCFEGNKVNYLVSDPNVKGVFDSFPSWVIDTNTVSIVKLTMNSNVYYLRDNKFNK